MNRLADKIALITGGGSGIGAAAGALFCSEGAGVMLVDMSAEGLAGTALKIREQSSGARVATFVAAVRLAAAFAAFSGSAADPGRFALLAGGSAGGALPFTFLAT